ncbi:MAG: flavodoxin family protein [Peptococcaceae bacterium]|nr:flavodoxin family protein [Peptococcaceae bacterium]
MKVIGFNGSARPQGNTYTLLEQVAEPLREKGIDVEIVHVGNAVMGCKACGICGKTKNEQCSIDDSLNGWIQSAKKADGILLGSPVYFSGIAGGMKAFLDRMFYVSGSNGNLFRHKVGASVVAVRRSGGVTTFDQLNHYLLYSEMLIPGSNYWNVGHGAARGEVAQDLEGGQIMKVLGENMAWLLQVVAAGKESVVMPEQRQKMYMNFIR